MFQKIKDIINKGNRFLITSHIDPDGDAVGSAFSLYWVLYSMNKKVVVYLKDPVPYHYKFLPAPDSITHELPKDQYDAIFVLDCGSLFRVGDCYEKLKDMGTIINIDHHNTNETFGKINVIDTGACSTAEVMYRLFDSLNISLSYEMAINIYTAIFTDTGSFRYENTNSRAFLICEEMLRRGVSPSYVSQMVHENHPKERFRLFGYILTTLETFSEDRVAIACVTLEMFKKTGTTREHSDGFVETLREIKGIEVAVLLREVESNKFKASMRSKGKIDVASICNLFGGGGHKNAAGCTINGSFEGVKGKIKEALKI
jgi:phosphoesterase RecJ-like protein